MSIRFAKGHGTENDFVLIDDPDGVLALTPELVARLCDRRRGLGADGLIRVVRTAALARDPEAGIPAEVLAGGSAMEAAGSGAGAGGGRAEAAQVPEWFMDYRNADGSTAQMCGNGVRVFAARLLAHGWADLPDGGEFRIGTRAGIKTVHRIKDSFGVDLGPWRISGGQAAVEAGADAAVTVPQLPGLTEQGQLAGLPGLGVNLGNPHVVVALPSLDALAALDLTAAPGVDPVPAEGINVEFIVPLPSDDQTGPAGPEGHLTMRVFERGVGETRSCGTGAVAAVLAARAWAGPDAPLHWTVDVPGGRLKVELPLGSGLAGGASVGLSGPAVLVADGELLELDQFGAVTVSTR